MRYILNKIIWVNIEDDINDATTGMTLHEHNCSVSNAVNAVKFYTLSYDVRSGSEITPCIKINKPLVVYRFWGNVMK